MAHVLRQARQSEHRAHLRLRLLLEILPVDGVEVVRPLLADHLDRLEAFVDVCLLLVEVVGVCGVRVEFVPIGIVNHGRLRFLVRVWLLFIEKGAVRSASVEWLIVRIELHVFDKGTLPLRLLWPEGLRVLGGGVEGNQPVLVFDSGNDLLPHLRFLAGVMLPVR